MMRQMDARKAQELARKLYGLSFEDARKVVEDEGLVPATIVLADAFEWALEIRRRLYNPDDFGWKGKLAEVEERVIRWEEGGRSWARWSEFHARRHGLEDIRGRIEMKTGAGDWLYSRRYSEWEDIVEEYRHKSGKVRWATECFIIECSWAELLEYLEQYNGKGLATWFKKDVKYNATISESVVMLQTWSNSKRKVEYLQACPYCE